MSCLTIYREESSQSTVLSNLFIDEYMKDANDAQIKVYLYLLRMISSHTATSVSDIADKFNHTEKEVIRALKYWETMHLVDLDYDQNQTLVGIHLKELAPPAPVSRLQVPVEDAQAFSKPSYTADQLREFKNRESASQLIIIAEAYIGRPLSVSEIQSLLYFTDVLHFSEDLTDYLLQYCIDKGKKDFRYMEKVAIAWAKDHITTPEQAQQSTSRYSADVYTILRALGSNNQPTETELSFITRWQKEYAFTLDVILEACRRTVLSTNSNRLKYADALLKKWFEQNVHHLTDIQALDELHQKSKKGQAQKNTVQNRFSPATQNQYDFDKLEKDLIGN